MALRRERPSFGSYTCWRDAQGIHFRHDGGTSDCGHTISREFAAAFLEELELPDNTTFHDWLRSLDLRRWESLHWQIHAEADDNFVWMGTDEIERWGRDFA